MTFTRLQGCVTKHGLVRDKLAIRVICLSVSMLTIFVSVYILYCAVFIIYPGCAILHSISEVYFCS